MPTGTMTYQGELTISTCWCGIVHAVPRELHDYQARCHRDRPESKVPDIYCPLGHAYIPAGEGKAIKLQRQLDERERQLEAEMAARRAAEDQLAAAEREAKRIAKRTAGGVCPCCNRSFVQLARHMKSQHPEHPK